jgi:hypothetical protein
MKIYIYFYFYKWQIHIPYVFCNQKCNVHSPSLSVCVCDLLDEICLKNTDIPCAWAQKGRIALYKQKGMDFDISTLL